MRFEGETAWLYLQSRHEVSPLWQVAVYHKLLAPDGKTRETDCANTEGVLTYQVLFLYFYSTIFKIMLVTMKTILLIIVALLGAVSIATIRPINEMSYCIDKGDQFLSSTEIQILVKNRDKLGLCKLGKENVIELNACLNRVKESNFVASIVVSIASIIKPQFKENYFTNIHNNGCEEFPETVINIFD